MKDAHAGTSPRRAADEALLEEQPILNGALPLSDGGGGGSYDDAFDLAGPLESHLQSRQYSRWRAFTNDPVVRTAAINLALIVTWYTFSTMLSLFNKLVLGKEHGLMGKGPFPAPFLMSSVQFFFQHVIARAILASGIVRRKSDGSQSWKEYFKKVVPNGVATGLDIGLSNYSLVFITLSFYVMCKSTTPLFLLVFAIAWGIEKPSWSLAAVVSVISAGLLLLVYGETKFHLVGFILVMLAAMLAGLRWTITQVLLQGTPGGHGSRAHGGPVEVLYQLTPVMSLTLLLLSLVHEQLWNTLPNSPYFEDFGATMLSIAIIAGGAFIALCMVVAEFALIANTSALTFMVAGTFKEIVTVAAAVIGLGEPFTWVNGLGLLVLIAGVVLFNYLKYQKLKAGEIQPLPARGQGTKDSEASEVVQYHSGGHHHAAGSSGGSSGGLPRSGSGSEVELTGGGGGGDVGHSPGRHSKDHHPVLMLGAREAFLLDDGEQLLAPSPGARHSPRLGRSSGGSGALLRGRSISPAPAGEGALSRQGRQLSV